MITNHKIFSNKKPDFAKLLEYGFCIEGDNYIFSQAITDAIFELRISVDKTGATAVKITDFATNEEYTLPYSDNSVGAFVVRVRNECEEILSDICNKCYTPDIFKSEYANLIIAYIRKKYAADAEYLWEKSPNNAVFRDKRSAKWYAALLTVKKRKIGIDEDGSVEIIDLKEKPEVISELVDNISYLSGYHMNKKHWYTIRLDGSVPIEDIYRRIDRSYSVVTGG